MTWLPIDHWQTPRDRMIVGRLPDHSEIPVRFNPLIQGWVDANGGAVARPIMWRELQPSES